MPSVSSVEYTPTTRECERPRPREASKIAVALQHLQQHNAADQLGAGATRARPLGDVANDILCGVAERDHLSGARLTSTVVVTAINGGRGIPDWFSMCATPGCFHKVTMDQSGCFFCNACKKTSRNAGAGYARARAFCSMLLFATIMSTHGRHRSS